MLEPLCVWHFRLRDLQAEQAIKALMAFILRVIDFGLAKWKRDFDNGPRYMYEVIVSCALPLEQRSPRNSFPRHEAVENPVSNVA